MTAVRHDEARARYEMEEAGVTAFAAYRRQSDQIIFHHTVVPEALGGRGVGTRLVRAALADARARGLEVVAQCSFVAAVLEREGRA